MIQNLGYWLALSALVAIAVATVATVGNSVTNLSPVSTGNSIVTTFTIPNGQLQPTVNPQ